MAPVAIRASGGYGHNTREEVIAAKPSAEFDADWGGGFMKPDVWIGIVYDGMVKNWARPQASKQFAYSRWTFATLRLNNAGCHAVFQIPDPFHGYEVHSRSMIFHRPRRVIICRKSVFKC